MGNAFRALILSMTLATGMAVSLAGVVAIFLFASSAQAQDFQPPRPPPMDPNADFDDMDEELMEMGDEGFRPPPPPPPAGQSGVGGPPNLGAPGGAGFDRFNGGTPMGGAVGGGNFGGGATAPKLKFKIVEGEFWEKGKRRGRADRTSAKK